MPAPTVSIIVPTFRRPRELAACLESIRSTVTLPHEVICIAVADDAATRDALEQQRVTTLLQHNRAGAVKAMNIGFRAATGDYLIQINDDCELLPHSVSNAIRFLQAPAHANVGQVAFFHDSPVRRNVHSQIQVEGVWYYVCHVRGLCYANFGLARRSLFEQLGYLDERYFMYGADPDFSMKVWHTAGLQVLPCPGALIHHAELNDDRASHERSQQNEDNRKLFEKWNLD